MERFEIPQSQWPSIQSELAEKDREVVPRVEEKAVKMTPNPLRDPQKRQQAVKIFRETLYELFADVMQAHGINNQEQIQRMLNDIQQQKARQFAQCVEQYHRPERRMQQPPQDGRMQESQGGGGQTFSSQPRDTNLDYHNYSNTQ